MFEKLINAFKWEIFHEEMCTTTIKHRDCGGLFESLYEGILVFEKNKNGRLRARFTAASGIITKLLNEDQTKFYLKKFDIKY
jgi:hypothetical protein